MRAYLIERSTMEWCFIRCALDDYLRSGALVSPRYERAVRELVDAIRAMTRYDDQHAFPDRPPVPMPERMRRVGGARCQPMGDMGDGIVARALDTCYGYEARCTCGFDGATYTDRNIATAEMIAHLAATIRGEHG